MQVKLLDTSFLLNQIRAYNKARKPKLKDKILSAVGIYSGLLEQQVLQRGLTEEERRTVHCFLSEFCEYQGLRVEISESRFCFVRAQLEKLFEQKI